MRYKDVKHLIKPIRKQTHWFGGCCLIAELYDIKLSFKHMDCDGVAGSNEIVVDLDLISSKNEKRFIIVFLHEMAHILQERAGYDLNCDNTVWSILRCERCADMIAYMLYKSHFEQSFDINLEDFDSYLYWDHIKNMVTDYLTGNTFWQDFYFDMMHH